MHPQIRQVGPGNCPICGMALEPVDASVATDDTELRTMTRRLWISTALSLPIALMAMSEFAPAIASAIDRTQWEPWFGWTQLVLATPVVLWCGAFFFKLGWQSIVNRSPNMFTLIAIGVAAAYGFSVFALLFPQVLPAAFMMNGAPPLYFEAAAIITTLVILGQVLELRARSQTSSAVRALLELAPPTALRIDADGQEREVALDQVHAGDRLRVRPGDEGAGRWCRARRPIEHRRIDDDRRAVAGDQGSGRKGDRRDGQSDRQFRDARRARRRRYLAGADRSDGV